MNLNREEGNLGGKSKHGEIKEYFLNAYAKTFYQALATRNLQLAKLLKVL